jgi:hypothetical protein
VAERGPPLAGSVPVPPGSLQPVRRTVATILLGVAALAAGCTGASDDPAPLGVTTPPPSATVGPTGASTPATPARTPAPTATPSANPTATPTASGPQAAYATLAATWQVARSRFFTAVSDGRPRTVAQQRALAATYLSASRRFATGLRAGTWPARARPAVRDLLAANAAQQVPLRAMATAASSGAFTGHLADYGVGAARENRAVAAVAQALG